MQIANSEKNKHARAPAATCPVSLMSMQTTNEATASYEGGRQAHLSFISCVLASLLSRVSADGR